MGQHKTCIVLIIVPLVLFSVCVYNAESKWVEDVINGRSDWEFMTRFCFLSQGSEEGGGKMYYDIKYPKAYGVQNLLFYYDVPGQWESVYDRDKTCEEKFDALGDFNYLEMSSNVCITRQINGEPWYFCEGTMDFTSSRERWWYVVVSRCGAAQDPQKSDYLYLDYRLHMTNGDTFLHKEYSADQFYIVIMNIVFFALYIKMMVLSIICAYKLKKRQLLHTTFKMYMVSITIWTLSLFCGVIAWCSYGNTGWELAPLEVTGRVFQAASNIVFILILVLIAKGYTIVRGKLTTKAAIKITVFILLYIVAMITLFIWEASLFDPAVVLYFYESPPGYGMVIIILIGWLWFTKSAVFTMKHHKSKSKFYITFYIIYTIWFWSSPIVILLAMFSMAKWTRQKTVTGVQLFIAYLGHLIFYILTLPSLVNSTFSYHVKTSQIAIVEGEEDEDERDAGVYSVSDPSQWTGTGPNLNMFITSKSGETSDGSRMYGPLERRSFELEPVSDSPPPSYPQALQHSTLPPIGGRPEDAHTSQAAEPLAPDLASSSPPPLYEEMVNSDLTPTPLPPLRGSGLPPIIPNDEISSREVHESDIAEMFQVDRREKK